MSDNSNQFSFGGSPPRAVPAEEVGSQLEGSDDMHSLDDLGGLGGAIVMVEEETYSSTSTPPPQDGGVDQQKQSEAVVSQLASRDDDDEIAVSRGTESQGPRGACSEVFPGMRQAGGRQGPSSSGQSGQSGSGAANGQGFPQAVAAPGCEPGDGVLGADAEGLGAVDAEEHAPRLSNAPGSKALAPSASAKGKPKAGANDSGPSRRRAGGTETDGEVASGGSSSRQISRRSSAGRGRNSSPPNFGPTRQSRPSRSASLGAKSAQQYGILMILVALFQLGLLLLGLSPQGVTEGMTIQDPVVDHLRSAVVLFRLPIGLCRVNLQMMLLLGCSMKRLLSGPPPGRLVQGPLP